MSLLKVNEIEVFNTTVLTLTASGGVSISNALATGGAISVTGTANQATTRTNLGLGSIATQASDSVTITGGSVSGITDLAIADGGTGASTAVVARRNLLPSMTNNAGKALVINANADDVEYVTASFADYITASSTATFTNKSGDISQWTNDTGYLSGTVAIANGGTGQTTLGAVDAADFGSTDAQGNNATSGFNLTADGTGGVSWAAPSVADGAVTNAKIATNAVRENQISSYDISIQANATQGYVLVADGAGNSEWLPNQSGGGGSGGSGTGDLDGGNSASVYTAGQTFDAGAST